MKKCLDTVCSQTLRDIQIICINDGSGDGTLDILREYEAADERFVVIDQPNAGVAAARNAGLDAASGEYIGFVDPDDYISPVMFQRLYLAAEEYRADVACMGATIAASKFSQMIISGGFQAASSSNAPRTNVITADIRFRRVSFCI